MIVAINILVKRLQVVRGPRRHMKMGQEDELRPMCLQRPNGSIRLIRRREQCRRNNIHRSWIPQSKRKRSLRQIEKRIAGLGLLRHPFESSHPTPGFGFTEVPAGRNYKYTFDVLAKTILAFIDALHLKRHALYVFDYGAPTPQSSFRIPGTSHSKPMSKKSRSP